MKISIIGGGIAGLSTAISLRQAGFEVKVYESAPEIGAVGAGIWMASNAMQVLDKFGLAAKVTELGMPLKRVAIADPELKPLSVMDQGAVKMEFGFPITAIHRADLQQILLEGLGREWVETNKKLSGVRQEGESVMAEFADGSQVRSDVLIGADGIHSQVRKAIFPPVRFRYSGQTCWRGVGKLQLAQEYREATYECWGNRTRFGFSQIGQGKVYWFAVANAPKGQSYLQESIQKDVLSRFDEFSAPIPAIVLATPPEKIIRTDLQDFAPIASWHQGRICLIGDAAHAMTPNMGQGGGQAVEDAWFLGQSFAAGGSPEEIFARFQARRHKKVKAIVADSWRFGKMAHLPFPRVRNFLARITPDRVMEKRMHKVFSLDY